MLNKIISYSLSNRILVLVASMLLLIGGTYTAMHTEVDVFPDLNAPTVVIMTEANGMAAEEVEQLVTFPVETAVNGATGVRRVRSSSTNGFSVVWVEFDWDTDIYLARQIVSEKLAIVSEALPPNVGRPTLGPQSSILGEMLIVGLTADSTSMLDLRTIADRIIRPRLLSTGGVAQVAVLGGDIKEYQIQLDPKRMRHYAISLDEVINATRQMNLNANGGVLYEYGNEYIVRGVLSTDRTERMGKAVVRSKDASRAPILLEDIADIGIGARLPRLGTASERGKPAVLMTVTKQPVTSTLELTDKLETSLKELQKNLPADVKVSTDIFRQSRFIESSIGNVQKSLLEGGIFVVIVLFLFLANARTTVISLVSLPLSLITSILALHYMGFTINTMSLGGMAIAIGSLVDDAIVDVENVYKRLRENRLKPAAEQLPITEVVFNASKEVRMPILNSTLIIIVSFVPLFFLSGMEGRMLVPLGIAFIVALAASTVVALTVTPVLCSYLLGKESIKEKGRANGDSLVARKMKEWYGQALTWVLAHRRGVLGGSIVLFITAFICFFTLGRSFLPPFNEGSFTINLSSLPGISLEESDKMGRRAEELLLSIPEIQTVARKTGRAELDEHALGVNVSEIEAPFELKDRPRSELVAEVRKKLGSIVGANIEIGQPISHRIDAMLSGTKANIAIKLFGDDLNRMFALGNEIKKAIQDIPGIADLNVEQQIERPQLILSPKREMLAKYGITLPEFAEVVNVCLAGETVSQVYEKAQSFDITVRVKENLRDRMERIGNLMIDTGDGQKIPLNYVAEIRSAMGPNTISRENVKRKIVISANVADRDLRSVVNDIQYRVDEQINLPEGYHLEYGGQFESEQAASRTLALTSFISIVVIFLLLYHEFRSVKESAIILINLPLALIGGVFALLVTTGEVSIPAIIGFISLFGIATRNGMLLISHYKHLQEEGHSLRDSIVRGSLDRLNPIMMTALSSALALIPLALGGDLPGNEIQSPMAKVILGGLLTSTFLNGFIVPIVYSFSHTLPRQKGQEQKKKKNLTAMKHTLTLCALLFTLMAAHAQTSGMDDILRQIETNNKELQANAYLITSQKLENKADNNLPDPTLSYAHLWDSDNNHKTVSELVVSQSFDFPTLYATRGKMNRLKTNALDAQATAFRQQVLLQAKEICLDIIMLQRLQDLLDERLKNAEELSALYAQRLKTGDANILEINKINLELLNVRTETRLNKTALENKIKELVALNGNRPFMPGRTTPDSYPSVQALHLTEYPAVPLPTDFRPVVAELLASDATLQALQGKSSAARQQVSASKQGWLPKLELGYRRNTESGRPLNGVVVGFSFPIFENRSKVKIAKTQVLNIDSQKENATLQAGAELWQLYEEARKLYVSMEEYKRTFGQQQDLTLLKQALMGGQISMIEYFVEVSVVYQSKTNLLQLENRYQKAMAQIYKSRL